jgi:hypothetical protein
MLLLCTLHISGSLLKSIRWLWVKIIPIFVDAGNSVAHVSLKDRHALMDISNGVVDGEMEAVMEVRERDG